MKYMFLHFVEHRNSILTLIFLSMIFAMGTARADLVSYTDDKGVVHFVDDESMIPEKFKDKQNIIIKKEAAPEVERKEVLTPAGAPGQKAGGPKDRYGNTPAFWRDKYRALVADKAGKERELRDLESQRDEVGRRLDSVRSKAYFVGDSQSVTEAATQELKFRELENRIKILLSQIDELNRKISFDIVDEVLQAGGSTDWLLKGE